METTYQYKPVRFFTLALALSWIPWLIAARLSANEETAGLAMLLNLLGLLLGPFTAALWFVYTSGNQALKDDFRNRLRNFRLWNPRYILILFLFMPVVTATAITLSLVIGESPEQFGIDPGALASLLPLIIVGLILAPVFEEIGWHGYGVDALRSKMGMLGSSVVFGVLWSLWHLPLVLIQGTYHHELVQTDMVFAINFFVSVVPAAIFANWLYYKHGRSIIAMIVLHSVINAAAMIPSTGQPAKTIATGVFTVFLVVIFLLDRASFLEGKRNYLR